jgi:hypothetical protein
MKARQGSQLLALFLPQRSRLGIRAKMRDTGINTLLVEHFQSGTWPKVVSRIEG